MRPRFRWRCLGVACLAMLCLSLVGPGADAARGGASPIDASSTALTALPGNTELPGNTALPSTLTNPGAGGLNPLSALSSGIGTMGVDVLGVGVLNGAGAALREAATVIDQTTAPRLQSTWFSSAYWRVAGLSALLALPFLFAAAAQALLRSDLTLLLRSAFGYLPLAMIGVSLAAPITMLLLSMSDQMSSVIAGAGAGGGVHFLRQTAAEITGLSILFGSPFLAVTIGLLILGSAVALAVEMLVREAAVYVVVLMLPLAFAALVWPARRIWAVRAVELLIALILSKFVIVAVLSLAGAAYGSSGAPSITRLLTAMALVMLSTLAPWVLVRLLPFTELAAGAGGAIRAELPRLATMPKEAMSAADGAAAWAERLSRRFRSSSEPASESDADDGKRRGADEAGPAKPDGAADADRGSLLLPRPGDTDANVRNGSPSRAGGEAPVESGSAISPIRPTTPRAERLPGLSSRWQGDDETVEFFLGRTMSGDGLDNQGAASLGRLPRGVEGSPSEAPQLLPPAPDDEPLPPSPGQDEGLL